MGTILKSVTILLALAIPMQAQQFSSAMRDIFGHEFPGYQWLDYPLDNFGVGSAYRDTKETANDKHFLCATFDCLNIEPIPASNTSENLNKQWLLVAASPNADKGYAEYGCGGPVEAAISKHSKSAIHAFLSKIVEVLGVSVDFEKSKGTTVTLVFTSACKRLLNGRIQKFIEGLENDDYGIRGAALNRELILIKGDIVIDKLEIKIHTSQDVKAQLDAKLAGAGVKKFGADSKFGVELSTDQDGDYHLKTTSPLIVGILAGRQPVSLSLGNEGSDKYRKGRPGGPGGEVGSSGGGISDKTVGHEGSTKSTRKTSKMKYKKATWDVEAWENTVVPVPQ